ncbi:MAG: hypothetical protein KGH87_01015 [Thaumarchaeota archaeon]|nr:hypothetical protein [Nitrososphaerota archaeon]
MDIRSNLGPFSTTPLILDILASFHWSAGNYRYTYTCYVIRFRISSLHLSIIIVIMTTGIIITFYEIVPNPIKTTKSGCMDPELKDLQFNPDLKIKQRVDSIVLANSEIKKIISTSAYCEIMSISTGYTENGADHSLNINLNNTKDLVVAVNLKNNSVISYELVNLTRTGPIGTWYQSINPEIIIFGVVAICVIVFIYLRLKE